MLAARSRHKLASVTERLGGLDTRAADATDPASIHALVERGDLLLSTVGPFDRWGRPALDAAIDNGAHYLDSTGEWRFWPEEVTAAAAASASAARRAAVAGGSGGSP